jgi:hypothetical protein
VRCWDVAGVVCEVDGCEVDGCEVDGCEVDAWVD